MSDVPARHARHRPSVSIHSPRTHRQGVPALLQGVRERENRELQHAFRSIGGIAGSDELTRILAVHTDQPISMLARWIVDRDVLSFTCDHRMMLPLFQFDLQVAAPRAEVKLVVRELATVMDEWETCLWFARPNAWLDDRSPLERVLVDPRAVHEAARAEGYLARS